MSNFIYQPNNSPQITIVDHFAQAFVDRDLELLGYMLNEKGLFQGENKATFLRDLDRLFKGLKCMYTSIQPYHGIAIDCHPGAPVVELHIKIEKGSVIQSFRIEDFFGKERGSGFLIFKYGLLCDNKKGVYGIFTPNITINMQEVKRRIIEN